MANYSGDEYSLTEDAARKLSEMYRWYMRNSRNPHPPRYRQNRGGSATLRLIKFTLAGALASTDASQASCTVNIVFSGSSPGSTVTVYNELGFSGASGNAGYAFYDKVNSQWKILQLKC